MKTKAKWLIPAIGLPVLAFFLYSFVNPTNDPSEAAGVEGEFVLPAGFDAYWNQGKGELSGYDLEQARYGEVHEGDAVLVFVSEPFSPKSLTKSGGTGPEIPVLKVNFDKKFLTGIYPYSMMMTVASPVNLKRHPRALKVATSSQEWCGHTYTQFNYRDGSYEMTEHSYFPREGDSEEKMEAVWLEDEIWTRLRIAPDRLPVGEVEMVPGTFYLRMRHQKIESRMATASNSPVPGNPSGMVYSLNYPKDKRTLSIQYQKEFPHQILGWEEIYSSGYGAGAKELKTKATLRNTIQLAYWNHNGNADRDLRKQLGF